MCKSPEKIVTCDHMDLKESLKILVRRTYLKIKGKKKKLFQINQSEFWNKFITEISLLSITGKYFRKQEIFLF